VVWTLGQTVQHGDVVAARHWFRITAIMQKIGWGAIEGCKKIWGIAQRLWLKKPPVGDSLEAVLKASAGLSWQRHELTGAVMAEHEKGGELELEHVRWAS
jgi:hypothetical protein